MGMQIKPFVFKTMRFQLLFVLFLGGFVPHFAKAQIEIKTYYDTTTRKKLWARYQINNTIDSFLVGSYQSFHPNGKPAMTGSYAEGKKDGAFVEYFPNGKKRLEASFSDGKKVGPMLAYDSTGQLLQRASFLENKLNDSLIAWYPGGGLKSKAYFEKDSIEGTALEYFRNGKVRKELTYKRGRPNGPSKEYYETGVLYIDARYTDGFLTGDYKVYFDNGQLDTESYLEKGTKNGGFASYSRSGKKILEGFYKNGQYHGEFRTYHPEGPLKSKVQWVEGQKQGPAEYFYLAGKLKERSTYENDVKVSAKGFYENGQPEFEKGFGPKDRPFGEWVLYFRNGKPSVREKYDEAGKLTGTRTIYDSLEVKNIEESWLHGKLSGKYRTFHPNGKVNQVLPYVGNFIQGISTEHHPNGKKSAEGLYKNSRKNGKWLHFDEEGSQTKIENWRMGKLLSSKQIRFVKKK